MADPRLARLTPAETKTLEAFLTGARKFLGRDLLEASLFGSRARGEGHEHSDVDVALVVTAEGRARRHAVYDLAYDLLLEHGVELAPTVITRDRLDELRSHERLFARELDRDGIPL